MEKKKLLEVRKRIKSQKPKFIRQDSHKKSEVKKRWRRPRGLHSKMRLHKKGYKRCPSKGYRSPVTIRGMHVSGLIPVMIHSKRRLEEIDAKEQGAIITKKIGMKKRIEMVKFAKEKGIIILNIKDPEKFLSDAEKKLREKKGKKEERKKQKEKKEKKKEEKGRKEEKLAEKLTEEEKKEQEKKEKDKLLIQKES